MITKEYDLNLRAHIKYRPYTSDEDVIRAILIDRSEYALFNNCNPRVIFDIGANIGAASILFANTYPGALIFAFEPEPENFKLLIENVAPYENVKPFNVALGAKTERRMLMASDDDTNLGGFSVHELGNDPSKAQSIDVVDILDFIKNERIPKIDLVKVDTEGCEHEILWRLYPTFLPDFIMGECHGKDDWRMFGYLSETHDIQTSKTLEQRCFPFHAKRRKNAGA